MRLFDFALLACLTTTLTDTAGAQCVPMPNTGCPGEPALVCTGPAAPCPPPPSGGCGFTLRCAPEFPAQFPCAGFAVVLIGSCQAPAFPILPPLGCAVGCSLSVSPLVASFPAPLEVPPNLMPPGSFWCAQCACIAVDGVRPCVNLGQAVTLVIEP